MSKERKASSSGSFGFGFFGFVGAIAAYISTPSFIGWAGAGKSLLVGAGTSFGATIVGVPAAIGGFIAGGIAGLLTRSKAVAATGALGGAIVCGLGGGVYGAFKGYDISKGWLTEGANNRTEISVEKDFNAAAPRATAALDKRVDLASAMRKPQSNSLLAVR